PTMLNCSQPNTLSLLEALQPVFKLSSIRPVMNMSTITNVSISFTMFGILGVVRDTKINSKVYYHIYWVLRLFSFCSMEKNSAPFTPYSYLMSDGFVIDGKPVKVVSSCRLDIYTFPFDIQNCSLSFNSYLHRSKKLILYFLSKLLENSKKVMTTMGEWELVGIKMKKFVFPSGDGDLYEELRFYVSVRRRATLYVVNLLIPSCFLITVDLFSFLLPPKQVDRSLFKMTLILGYTVFLLIMNDLLPVTGNTIPLINVFLSLCLALMVASLLETILITNLLFGSANYSPVPHWISVFVLHILGRLVRGAPVQKRSLNEDKALEELRSLGKELQALCLQLEQQQSGNQGSEEWIQVGLIIDRLLFALYILFILVSFITIIIIWRQSHNIA
uniref:Uncharacterized protein n=1 Tax=Seriola lalandi dorsalis TaxID=1841481 RepID=A0A3B4XVD6_SERLL